MLKMVCPPIANYTYEHMEKRLRLSQKSTDKKGNMAILVENQAASMVHVKKQWSLLEVFCRHRPLGSTTRISL